MLKNKLSARADILSKIRHFFAEHSILEVETPLLSQSTNPDPNLDSFTTENYYLQTSPEFAMKRLLVAGSGPIYQICKAFRAGESGRLHNPEFTMLEWYRPGFKLENLMDEAEELLTLLLKTPPAMRVSYQKLFQEFLNINPHATTKEELKSIAHRHDEFKNLDCREKDHWLNLFMTHCIEPKLQGLVFIYDYPASQAMLATVQEGLAKRFEVYIDGIEIGNGFQELTDATIQRQRFMDDNEKRQALGKPTIPFDERFLSALEHGLPECAGIAIGVDRLIMLSARINKLADVITFPIECA